MTFITVTADADGNLPDEIPIQSDGSPFPFVLVVGSETTFSDSRTDLVGLIIEGYELIPQTPAGDREALIARSAFAARYADGLQQLLVAEAVDKGAFKVNDASQVMLEALFNPRATHAFQSKSGEWTGPVPLVIAAHLYAPYQDTPALPQGDVLVIDGYTETTFLDSLDSAGLIQMNVYQPVAAATR